MSRLKRFGRHFVNGLIGGFVGSRLHRRAREAAKAQDYAREYVFRKDMVVPRFSNLRFSDDIPNVSGRGAYVKRRRSTKKKTYTKKKNIVVAPSKLKTFLKYFGQALVAGAVGAGAKRYLVPNDNLQADYNKVSGKAKSVASYVSNNVPSAEQLKSYFSRFGRGAASSAGSVFGSRMMQM